MPRRPNASRPSAEGRARVIARIAVAAWAVLVFAAYWAFRLPGSP